ncbi:MAG: DNA-directed RNA polymerase subunit omega [Acidimicrobiales bacterium]
MAERPTMMDPPVESLLDKVDSKFTLVTLSSMRAREINDYYNQLGEGLGRIVPPQVTSVSGKPLSIAFEEIAADKVKYERAPSEEEEAEGRALAEAAEAAAAEAEAAAAAEAPAAGGAVGEDAAVVDEGPSAG